MRKESRRVRTTTKALQSNPVPAKQLSRIQEPTPANRVAIEMLARSKGLALEALATADNTTPLRRLTTSEQTPAVNLAESRATANEMRELSPSIDRLAALHHRAYREMATGRAPYAGRASMSQIPSPPQPDRLTTAGLGPSREPRISERQPTTEEQW